MLFLSRMNNTTHILISSPKSANAPTVILDKRKLLVNGKLGVIYNYAVSTENGSVVEKGMFQEENEIDIVLSGTSTHYQLDIFNVDFHFIYQFVTSVESPDA